MRLKNPTVYNVILWNFNKDDIEYYNIMPYLINCWKEDKKRRHKLWDIKKKFTENDTRMPETFEEFKEFIRTNSQYQFWSRCEYEIIVCGWPKHKNEKKIDAFTQIMQNIDVITSHFMEYITKTSVDEQAFEQIVSRFEHYLDNISHKEPDSYGILIHDNNETVSRKHTELTGMVQIADLCSVALRRFFENGETDLFNRIMPRFDSHRGKIVGVRHFSEPTCACEICANHASK